MKFLSVAIALTMFAMVAGNPTGPEVAPPEPGDDELDVSSLNSLRDQIWDLSERDAVSGLSERACKSSRCRCNKVGGIMCGNSRINPYCISSHVYQCNKGGYTCDFGVRNSCKKCGKLSC